MSNIAITGITFDKLPNSLKMLAFDEDPRISEAVRKILNAKGIAYYAEPPSSSNSETDSESDSGVSSSESDGDDE